MNDELIRLTKKELEKIEEFNIADKYSIVKYFPKPVQQLKLDVNRNYMCIYYFKNNEDYCIFKLLTNMDEYVHQLRKSIKHEYEVYRDVVLEKDIICHYYFNYDLDPFFGKVKSVDGDDRFGCIGSFHVIATFGNWESEKT